MKKSSIFFTHKIYNKLFVKRLFMMLSVVIFIEIVLLGAYVQQEEKRSEDLFQVIYQSEAVLIRQSLESNLHEFLSDLSILMHSNDIANYLNDSSEVSNIAEVTRIFKNFLSNDSALTRLSLFSPTGSSIVTINSQVNPFPFPLQLNLNNEFRHDEIIQNQAHLLSKDDITLIQFTQPLYDNSGQQKGFLQASYSLGAVLSEVRQHSETHPETYYGFLYQDAVLFEWRKSEWVQTSLNLPVSKSYYSARDNYVYLEVFNLNELLNSQEESGFESTDTFYLTLQNQKPPSFLQTRDVRNIMILELMILLTWSAIAFFVARLSSLRENDRNDQKLTKDVFEYLDEALVITDSQANILYANPKFSKIMMYPQKKLLGLPMSIFQSKHHNAAFYRNLWASLDQQNFWEGKIWDLNQNGEEILSNAKLFKLEHDDGLVRYFGVYNPVIDNQDTRKQDYKMRYYDTSTNLPNENLLPRLVHKAINSQTDTSEKIGIVILSYDKLCDNASKHNTAIKKIATRLLNESDLTNTTLVRSGLKEFVLIFTHIKSQNQLFSRVAEVRTILDQPFQLTEMGTCQIQYSIGLSIYPDDEDTPLNLVEHARVQLDTYSSIPIQDANRLSAYQRYFHINSGLESAIKNGELYLVYQPKVNPQTNEVMGLEALLRWNHSDLGSISPTEFIPIAESNGTIITIGEWVLMQVIAFQQNMILQGNVPLSISINVSFLQLKDPHFYNQIQLMLDVYELPHHLIELELTESILMADQTECSKMLRQLKELGIRISIDDFGTGYSSLSYLESLPIDTVKIDRIFIKDYPNSNGNLLRAVSRMLQDLSITIVLEGVETKEQLIYAKELGIHLIQGYYYSKPLPEEEIIAYIQKHANN